MSRYLSFATLPLAAIPVAFLTVAACSTVGATASEPTGEAHAICAADQLARFKGQPANQALGSEILAASGAQKLRWVTPGMAVTMDYLPDRVTVHLDKNGAVSHAVCG